MRRPARAVYYPWLVVALASVTVGVAFGCRSTFSVFLVAVIEEFRWSRAATSGALFLGAVVWSLAATFIGIFLDRFGPRVLFPLGALVMALGFTITGMTQNIAQFYVGMGIFMALGFASLPMSTQATIISNWFVTRRGAAMGIAASGMGVGIFVLVPLAEFLIATHGWRNACFVLAGLLVALIAPANAVLQRHRPEDVGLSADGNTLSKSPLSAPRENSWTLKRALHNYRFWALALGTLTGAIPLHMILIHQVAALVDHGYPKALAASILGFTGLFTSPSMILWGAASDRIGREWAYTLGSVAMILGTLLLLYARDPSQVWMLYLYALLFALGFGTRQALYPTIAADLFHGTNFGAINGALALFIGAGSGIGPWLGGHLFDRFGNYDTAFWSANLLAAVSISLIWAAGPRHFRMSR